MANKQKNTTRAETLRVIRAALESAPMKRMGLSREEPQGAEFIYISAPMRDVLVNLIDGVLKDA